VTDFEAVYQAYFRDVYRYALALCRDEALAEEITQEAFFKALEHMDQFDGKSKLSVWLCSIARNTYFSMLRKEKYIHKEPVTELPGGIDPEQRLLNREEAFTAHRILHRLPEPYREVFSLRTFAQLSFQQIAQLFGKTESWARVTYHRARLKIKEELP
jgi:RNA polymerase sigma-70 factor (ECF subfamily)